MTDLQLLLSIGIPSLLIALSIFQNNVRFSALEKRIDGLDKRADSTDARFTKMEGDLDARFSKANSDLDARFSKVNSDLDARFSKVNGDLDARLNRSDAGIETRFNKLEADLRAFRAEHHQDLIGIHEDLKQFYGMTTKLEGRMDEISKR